MYDLFVRLSRCETAALASTTKHRRTTTTNKATTTTTTILTANAKRRIPEIRYTNAEKLKGLANHVDADVLKHVSLNSRVCSIDDNADGAGDKDRQFGRFGTGSF